MPSHITPAANVLCLPHWRACGARSLDPPDYESVCLPGLPLPPRIWPVAPLQASRAQDITSTIATSYRMPFHCLADVFYVCYGREPPRIGSRSPELRHAPSLRTSTINIGMPNTFTACTRGIY